MTSVVDQEMSIAPELLEAYPNLDDAKREIVAHDEARSWYRWARLGQDVLARPPHD